MALDEWGERWVVAHGLAVLDAASGDATAPVLASVGLQVPAQDLGDLHAWAGYPKLRGKGLEPDIVRKMAPQVKSMLAALGPFAEDLSSDRLHSVQVQAILGGSGAPGPCGIMPSSISIAPGSSSSIVPLAGEVRVDGQVKKTICELSEPVAWPLPAGSALLQWEQTAVLGLAVVPPEPLEGEQE